MNSNKKTVKVVNNEREYISVRDFFTRISSDYFPPLDEREGGVDQYLKGTILYLEGNNGIEGVLAYSNQDNKVEVDITGIEKNKRGSRTFRRLLEEAVKEEQNNAQTVRTQTWSTNYEMKSILKKLGFRKVLDIYGDLDPNRVSEIYEADFDEIKKFINNETVRPVLQPNWMWKAAAAIWLTGAAYLSVEAIRNPESLEDLSKAVVADLIICTQHQPTL